MKFLLQGMTKFAYSDFTFTSKQLCDWLVTPDTLPLLACKSYHAVKCSHKQKCISQSAKRLWWRSAKVSDSRGGDMRIAPRFLRSSHAFLLGALAVSLLSTWRYRIMAGPMSLHCDCIRQQECCCWMLACLTSQQHAIVYLREGSAPTILRAATLR